MCFDVPIYWCALADLLFLGIVAGVPIGLILLVRYMLRSDDRAEDDR